MYQACSTISFAQAITDGNAFRLEWLLNEQDLPQNMYMRYRTFDNKFIEVKMVKCIDYFGQEQILLKGVYIRRHCIIFLVSVCQSM